MSSDHLLTCQHFAGRIRTWQDLPSGAPATVPAMAPSVLGYTIAHASRVTGHTRNQLEFLDRSGLLSPRPLRPHSRRRHFEFFDLVVLRALARMRGDGPDRLSERRARQIVQALAGLRGRALTGRWLVSDGSSAFWLDHGSAAHVASRTRSALLVMVDLHAIEHEVRRELARVQLPAPTVELVGS